MHRASTIRRRGQRLRYRGFVRTIWGGGVGARFRGWRSGLVPGCQVLGLAVGVGAGLPGSWVSGRSQCRVAAFSVSGLLELAFFFITISHCAWRHVICPKRQRNEAKKTLSERGLVS